MGRRPLRVVVQQQISETSHQERAWLDTATGAVIPYSFAAVLDVRLPEG